MRQGCYPPGPPVGRVAARSRFVANSLAGSIEIYTGLLTIASRLQAHRRAATLLEGIMIPAASLVNYQPMRSGVPVARSEDLCHLA
jgi:hypothetical protein